MHSSNHTLLPELKPTFVAAFDLDTSLDPCANKRQVSNSRRGILLHVGQVATPARMGSGTRV